MFYRFLFIISCIFACVQLQAQPEPCGDPPVMTSICADACVICDIDGFMGRHDSNIPGEAPPGFAGSCTFVAHNMQWIAFIAGSTDLMVEMSVSNCQSGLGLEFGIYKGNDCQDLELVTNCFGGASTNSTVGPGQAGVINNTEPLVIGQYYYLVMDGGQGDNCDWSFQVLEGSTMVPEITVTSPILGDMDTCPNLLQTYTSEAVFGATIYDWTVNGQPAGNNTDPFLDYSFAADGNYTICVTARNACDSGPITCETVVVTSLPPTEIVDVFCEGDCYVVAGQQICDEGDYTFTILSVEGCDSIINASLTELPNPITDLMVNICDGDTLFVAGNPYFTTGIYQENTPNIYDCDSTINLDLFVIICNIQSNVVSNSTVCNGTATGSIDFEVANGTPPFLYSWNQLGTTNNGSGNITSLGQNITISNLSAGTYVITVDDGFGNFDVIISEVGQPEPLEVSLIPSDYNGYGVSCFNGIDGSLTANVSGGMSPYFYTWSNGFSDPTLNMLSAGNYILIVTDALGCQSSATFTLEQPDPMNPDISFNNAGCEGLFSGSIEVNNVTGGVGPYSYSLINGIPESSPVFEDLGPDAYSVFIFDGNKCVEEFGGFITAPDIPNISLGDDITVNLGDSITLDVGINNSTIDSIIWTTSELLSCYDCLDPSVTPLYTATYALEVISIDGCSDMSTIAITVEKNRKFYAPNAFSPNDDGFNDVFALNGSAEVAQYDLRIFDRWGNPVFSQNGITSSTEESLSWDGSFKGQKLDPGVFAWVADITFIDGESKNYSGSIALIK